MCILRFGSWRECFLFWVCRWHCRKRDLCQMIGSYSHEFMLQIVEIVQLESQDKYAVAGRPI